MTYRYYLSLPRSISAECIQEKASAGSQGYLHEAEFGLANSEEEGARAGATLSHHQYAHCFYRRLIPEWGWDFNFELVVSEVFYLGLHRGVLDCHPGIPRETDPCKGLFPDVQLRRVNRHSLHANDSTLLRNRDGWPLVWVFGPNNSAVEAVEVERRQLYPSVSGLEENTNPLWHLFAGCLKHRNEEREAEQRQAVPIAVYH